MWSPTVLLAYLCACTLLLFGDRGAISSNAISGSGKHSLRHDFHLDVASSGWIYAAGMVGLTLSAPLAAHFSIRFNALRLVGCGVLIVALANVGTALSPSFPILLLSRALTGVGCGPFMSLSPSLVNDSAPRDKRGLYLAFFFISLPVGFALGFAWSTLIGESYGWRYVFIAEAAVMAPLAAWALFARSPNDIERAAEAEAAAHKGFWSDVRECLSHPVVVLALLARATFIGGLGGVSFFGSKAAKSILDIDTSEADLIFGAANCFAGAAGTLFGGIVLDKLGPSVRNALFVCMVSIGSSGIALALTFAFTGQVATFLPGFIAAESFMFSTASPATAVFLWSLPSASLRTTAVALSEVTNHVLGDVPLPPLLGLLQKHVKNWRVTMCACAGTFGMAALIFGLARCVVGRLEAKVDDVEELLIAESDGGVEDGDNDDDGALEEPLLSNN